MAGIQLTGLFSGMNWGNTIDELIAADSGPLDTLEATETANKAKITSLGGLGTDLANLQNAVQGLGDYGTNVFAGRAAALVGSNTATSSWTPSAGANTPIGSYSIDVTRLATEAQLNGATGISAPLSSTSDVSGLTLANLPTAAAVTAGTFTVNGKQVTVALTDSLQDALNAISTATGGTVTAAYNPTADGVTLTSSSGSVVLGAANDSSNFLTALGLANNGTATVSSATALGALSLANDLTSDNTLTPLSGLDSSGSGAFTINGVSFSYTAASMTLSTLIDQINNSAAGVTASYDTQQNRMVLVNNVTGDTGIATADTTGNLLATLGLTTGATLQSGVNAEFTVNGGLTRTSPSNNLSSAALGVEGLSVTVDAAGTQAVQVTPDTAGMQTAIQSFITAYNQLQTDITTDTQISSVSGTVTTSILSGNSEVQDWGENLRSLVFASLPGLSGGITSLDNIGVGFTGTANQLSITDSAALQSALANNPSGVAAFFQSGSAGFTYALNGYLSNTITDNTEIQNNLETTDTGIDSQISVLNEQLTAERATLTAEFTAMEDAIQQSQDQAAQLSGSSSSSSSSSSSGGSTISSSAYSTPSSSSSSSSGSTSASSGSSSSGTSSTTG
jgi:flagellar hook-associated protein 2